MLSKLQTTILPQISLRLEITLGIVKQKWYFLD